MTKPYATNNFFHLSYLPGEVSGTLRATSIAVWERGASKLEMHVFPTPEFNQRFRSLPAPKTLPEDEMTKPWATNYFFTTHTCPGKCRGYSE